MNERRIHQVFEISIILKGLHGLIECVGGVVLAVASTNSVTRLIGYLTQGELAEDPHDFVASHLVDWASHFSHDTKTFYAVYLLAHGIIKIVLVAALLRNMLWAYPASLVALALFVVYQMYRFAETQSPVMLLLTLFDVFVMWLIWHEYRLVRRLRAASAG